MTNKAKLYNRNLKWLENVLQNRKTILACFFTAILFCSMLACTSNEHRSLSTRINPILKKANTLIETNPDSSLLLTDYVVRILEQSDQNDSLYVAAQYIKGLSIREKGFHPKAYDHLNELYQYAVQHNDTSSQALILYRIGFWHYFDNHYFLAKEYLSQSLAIYRKLNDKHMVADVMLYLAISNLNLGNYDEAQRGLFRSMRIFEQYKDSYKLGLSYINIGNLFHELNENDKSLAYFNKSVSEFQKSNDSASLASVYVNIGLIQKRNKNLDSALYFYNLSNQLNANNVNRITQIINTYNIADIYVLLNKFEEAKVNLNWCLENCLKENVTEGIPRIYSCYASIHLKLKEYDKAMVRIDSAIVMSDSLKLRPLKKQLLAMKLEILDSMGNESAVQEIKIKIKSIDDSLSKDALRDELKQAEQLKQDKQALEKLKWIKKKEKYDYIDIIKTVLLILIPLVLTAVLLFNYRRNQS